MFIVLIPKIGNRININHFWAISLCNFSYEVVAKICMEDLVVSWKILFMLMKELS